jgi:hypothetical protein
MNVAQRVASRIVLDLKLDQDHWRRHDRAFWAQTLAAAADEAARHLMRVESYEMEESRVLLRLRGRYPAKEMTRRWENDETLMRLRARLFDLGGTAAFAVEDLE